MEHPRFGLIIGLIALKDIQKGQEIYVDYGYELLKKGDQPPWFEEALEKHQNTKRLK